MQTHRKTYAILAIGLSLSVAIHTSWFKQPPTNRAFAEAARIASVFADGQTKVFSTEASTVSGVLKRANISLASDDLVEPALATKIPESFFNINVYRARPVLIVDGSKQYLVHSAYQSPKLLAQAAGLTIFPEDLFRSSIVSDFARDQVVGERVIITRSKPFTVLADGRILALRTQAKTVGAALAAQKISLGLKDTVTPGAEQPLLAGMTLKITRVAETTIAVDEVLNRPVQTIYDHNLLRGNTTVKAEGSDGKRTVTYLIHYRDGVEIKRDTLKVAGLVNPTQRVVVLGTKVYYANEVVAMAEQLAANRGWVNDQWDALYNLWTKESNFNPYAEGSYVPGLGRACGIPQALPCSKLPGWSPTDPAAQINWGLNYIANRYGSPANAWSYWQTHHSY